MSSPRVFILEDVGSRGNVDLSDAKRFGEIVKLYNRGEKHPGIFSSDLEGDIYDRLTRYRFDPKIDYIVVVGPLIGVFRLGVTIGSEFSKVRTLCFNSVEQKYVEVCV